VTGTVRSNSTNKARCRAIIREVLLFIAVLVTVLTVCSQSISSRPTTQRIELPEGPGKQVVQSACGTCHEFGQFSRLNFEREDWDVAVKTMVVGGASLKKAEIPVAIDYLTKNFKGEHVPGVAVGGKVQASVTEWAVPTPNSMPEDSLYTKRGVTWFAGEFADLLGRFDLKTQEFRAIHLRPGSRPTSLVEHVGGAVQGTIYFPSRTGAYIGEFDPNTGDVREFRIHGPKLLLRDIAFDPNGALWFTVMKARPPQYPRGSKIGTLNLFTAEVKLGDIPTPNADPGGLAVNSKGIPFFTEGDSPRLASVYPVTMKVTEYPLPNPGSGVRSLAVTPDDTVWFTDYLRGYLGRFDPKTGKFSEWPSPSGHSSRPDGITNVGNIIWYSESGSKPNMLVRFDPSTEKFQTWSVKAGGGINRIHAQPDGSLWFTSPLTNGIGHIAIKEE
jgi:virginiamycin B lyase